jgi:hypothetical protein
MLILSYENCKPGEGDPKVKECCEKKKPTKPNEPPTTGTGDCCYDLWMEEDTEVTGQLNRAEKEVAFITNHLNLAKAHRDFWGAWYDELTKVDDSARKVCNQLEIILHHLHRIGKNTSLTVRSLRILYCMIRDFFMQIDLLKTKYDTLISCIQCINNPALAPGQPVRKLIDDYGAKLDAVIGTRDALLDAFVVILGQANRLDKNLDHQFGLRTVLKEWKKAFHCDQHCYDKKDEQHPHPQPQQNPQMNEGQIEDIGLWPMLEFPICDSEYFKYISKIYDEEEMLVDKLNMELLEAMKKKDKFQAWKDGLDAVVKAVDPATRCAVTAK